MTHPPLADHAERTVRAYRQLIGPARAAARRHGYALAVHGSLLRDVDLVAVPWAEKASPAAKVAEAIRRAVARACGTAQQLERDAYHRKGCPKWKPHGRLTWAFHLKSGGGGPYVDLSVMPSLSVMPPPRRSR